MYSAVPLRWLVVQVLFTTSWPLGGRVGPRPGVIVDRGEHHGGLVDHPGAVASRSRSIHDSERSGLGVTALGADRCRSVCRVYELATVVAVVSPCSGAG